MNKKIKTKFEDEKEKETTIEEVNEMMVNNAIVDLKTAHSLLIRKECSIYEPFEEEVDEGLDTSEKINCMVSLKLIRLLIKSAIETMERTLE